MVETEKPDTITDEEWKEMFGETWSERQDRISASIQGMQERRELTNKGWCSFSPSSSASNNKPCECSWAFGQMSNQCHYYRQNSCFSFLLDCIPLGARVVVRFSEEDADRVTYVSCPCMTMVKRDKTTWEGFSTMTICCITLTSSVEPMEIKIEPSVSK